MDLSRDTIVIFLLQPQFSLEQLQGAQGGRAAFLWGNKRAFSAFGAVKFIQIFSAYY